MSDLGKTELPITTYLLIERQRSVLTIWFNRPEVKNALNAQMTEELVEVLSLVRDDRSIRTIVLRGKGGVFCAGGDIKGFKSEMQAIHATEVAKSNRSFGDVMMMLNEQPQVVIILIEGAAIGGGLGLACVADITLVTEDARFRLSETSLGIPPAQIAPFVCERVGLTQARRLMLTGAKFKGQEAVTLGIAHYVAKDTEALEAKCRAILQQINACAPSANAVTKGILFEGLRQPRPAALDFAAHGFAQCMLSSEGREGVAAFVEKRKAYWNEESH
jgi:isohexenylglutaconyl-CoA hydratase